MAKKVVIVGGHGQVSLRLARLIGPSNEVISLIRDPSHAAEITEASAKPLLLSLEDAPVADLSVAFEGAEVVYFSAGAGGKGGPERTRKVDYEGALKVFDAIEAVQGSKPRLILVSAVDVRDLNKVPDYYTEEDLAVSKRMWSAIPVYMQSKYDADKNLIQRTAFKWTILRPGGLNNNPGSGTASIGKTHITQSISRDDVAKCLALLLNREDAAGLAIDIVGGDDPIELALEATIRKRESSWIG
ncbi:hypothetical protein JAAARDRAFT_318144 [Jaapia argillacea MUCL 33604]|uniref:NAD(P)-binding domain-containing protein n=1 Tax=Jaapia argillacea MUCL 33604 TaxID=933084 RepID=A0A067PMJ9_9AGAM|nr:hypothetical protein JAAARDRAFT_318144 [Jaapia argillacea MUCL 33604]